MLTLLFPILGVFNYLVGSGRPEFGAVWVVLIVGAAVVVYGVAPWALRTGPNRSSGRPSADGRMVTLGIVYLVIVLVGFARAIVGGHRPLLAGLAELAIVGVVVPFVWIGVLQAHGRWGPAGPVRALTVSLALYVGANVVAYALGVRSSGLEARYLREMISLWNSSGFRAIFPFALSGQMLSICAGSAGVLALDIQGPRRWRYPGLLLTWVFVGSVMWGHGGRGPTFAMFLAMIAVWLTSGRRRATRALSMAALAGAMLIPFAALSTTLFVRAESGMGGVAQAVSRNAGDIATLSNRDLMWATAIRGLLEQSPTQWVAGSGARSQIASGLSRRWAFLFDHSYRDPENTTVHNSYLQVMLDYGLLGTLVFVGGLILLVWRASGFAPSSESGRYVVVWAVIYVALTAALEDSLTYYSLDTWFLLIALYMTVAVRAGDRPEPADSDSSAYLELGTAPPPGRAVAEAQMPLG